MKKKAEKKEQFFVALADVELSTGERYKSGHKFLKDDLEKEDFDALREMRALASESEVEKAEKIAGRATTEAIAEAVAELAPATVLSSDPDDVSEIEV